MVSVAVICSPMVPGLLPVALIGCIAHYLMNKNLIFNLSKLPNFSSKRLPFKVYENFMFLIILWVVALLIFWNHARDDFSLSLLRTLCLICVTLIFLPISWILSCFSVETIETLEQPRSFKYAKIKKYSEINFAHDYERSYPLTKSIGKMRRNHMIQDNK